MILQAAVVHHPGMASSDDQASLPEPRDALPLRPGRCDSGCSIKLTEREQKETAVRQVMNNVEQWNRLAQKDLDQE